MDPYQNILDATARHRSHHHCKAYPFGDGASFGDRVTVHHGAFEDVLPRLASGYDIAFFDGFAPSLQDLDLLASLLRIGGILISANLGLSGRETAAYREMICDPENWMTSLMAEGGRTAVSVKLRTGKGP
ncbi:class I SAM-dependent methyltransferase [Rhizobium sp. WW_1]|uniref:class I SAM-dependent methyltransferase n=1 Tax=Rhizobium sp. WW_1 TaxID=1907375 RepID=UPI001603FFE4|nr:class I SAM-dependent methyltransferase [Rhizobium sp. WW_1]